MKIYVAGPMRGIPHFNFPAFNAAAAALRAAGHEVFNPAERDIERHNGVDISADNATGSLEHAETNYGFSRRAALCDDTTWICTHADAIALLPGWEDSLGAKAELALARALGLAVMLVNRTGAIIHTETVTEGRHAVAAE